MWTNAEIVNMADVAIEIEKCAQAKSDGGAKTCASSACDIPDSWGSWVLLDWKLTYRTYHKSSQHVGSSYLCDG